MLSKILIGSAIVLAATLTATPAVAQKACDVGGTDGGANANPADGFAFPSGTGSFACGPGAASNGANSIAIGNSFALADESITLGNDAVVNSTTIAGIAIGAHITINQPGGGIPYITPPAGDLGSISLGGFSGVSGNNNLAIGSGATIGVGGVGGFDVDSAIALGTRAVVTADDAVAIGAQATAAHANSVAIGANTTTTAANQVNVGGRTISGVTNGALSATSTDVVTGQQLFVTNTNVTANTTAITAIQTVNTTQATQITALQAADTGFDTRINALEAIATNIDDRLDDVEDHGDAGTATAIALSGAMFLPGKTFNLTGNVGAYRGAVAAALQFGAMVSENAAVNAGIAKGFNKNGKTGLRAGFTFGW